MLTPLRNIGHSSVGSALQRWAVQGGLLVASCTAGGLLAEGLSRVVLNPVDYLAVDPVSDPVLRHRLEPYAGGHDEWGFRNPEVPESADIVTIGDSQTYGNSAPARLSWPAQLGELTSSRVYNLGLGDYGPVQYHELLRTRALQLGPAVIVVGFYYGNDLRNAYTAVYGLSHWGALRQEGIPELSESQPVLPPKRVLGPVRDWLARHSVVYRLASSSALGGYVREVEFPTWDATPGIIMLRHPRHGGQVGFQPLGQLKVLDLEDVTIQEGLRLSLDRLQRMAEECRAAGVHLLIALIPTKERVHAPWLTERSDLPEYEGIRALLHNEQDADRQVKEHLDRLGVRYLDLEAPLQEAAAVTAIYPASHDVHPNSDGYAIIAHAVATAIGDWLPQPAPAAARR